MNKKKATNSDNQSYWRMIENLVEQDPEELALPGGDLDNPTLKNLIDISKLQSLIDDFRDLTGICVGIGDNEGNILAASGWQEICDKFHRVHPEMSKHCFESDTELTNNIPAGTVKCRKCKNHMWDIATPIFVGEKHLGNIYLGQFFFDDEEVDYDLFRAQARRYRLDEKAYIKALERVPHLNRDKVFKVMEFFVRLAGMLSQLTYSKFMLAQTTTEQEKIMNSLHENEQRWQFALEASESGAWDWDLWKCEIFISRQWKAILGYAEEEIEDDFEKWQELVHPEDRKHFTDNFNKLLNGTIELISIEYRALCKDNEYKWMICRGKVISRDKKGQPLRALGIQANVNPRKEVEKALKDSRKQLDDIIEFLPDATFVIDSEGKVIAWNRTMEQNTGILKSKVMGKASKEYSYLLLGSRMKMLIDQALQPDTPLPELNERYMNLKHNGDWLYGEVYLPSIGVSRRSAKAHYVAATASTLRDESGEIVGAIQTLRDITEQKTSEEKLKHISMHDALTGLYNRAYFEEELDRLTNSRDYPITIISADMDDLKVINDTLGHATGDEYLKACARVLKEGLRHSDTLARVGGDEFAAFLPRTNAGNAKKVVNRIRSAISDFNKRDNNIDLYISIGMATAEDESDPLEEVFKKADNNMYQVKNSHRLL